LSQRVASSRAATWCGLPCQTRIAEMTRKASPAATRRISGAGQRQNRSDRPRRVMLVEDELLPALLLEEIVRDAGFTVVGPVGRLQEAIDMAKAECIDAAVLDIQLDRDTVFPVADILKGRRIPFAFVTARSEAEIELLHRGRPVWTKPLLQDQIKRGLKDLISRR